MVRESKDSSIKSKPEVHKSSEFTDSKAILSNQSKAILSEDEGQSLKKMDVGLLAS